MTTVRDVMTRSVFSVTPDTPLKDVARLLVDNGISGVPVVGPGRTVLGVVSEADFLVKERGAGGVRHRPLAALIGESRDTIRDLAKVEAATAGEAMSAPAVTVEADATIAQAAEAMIARGVNRLPVTDGDALVGIVTRADLVRAYVRSDEQLAETIRDDVLRRTLWLDPAQFEVSVTDGVARIGGTVDRRSTADMIERVAAMAPGVVRVDCEVEWEVEDRDIEAPAADYISSYKAPRTH
jgi:CBS domain-containing protein